MNCVAIASADGYTQESVRHAFDKLMQEMGYDEKNPFGKFIKPGMTVFIKPNWVASRWRQSCEHVDTIYSVITHPLIVEAVADRVAVALDGKGRIIIGDNPSIDADFDELMKLTGIRKLCQKYDVSCEIVDMRPLVCKSLDDYGKKDRMAVQTGDPQGSIEINLGKESLLYSLDSSLFRGVFDEREDTVNSHTGERQLYTYGRSLYDADVYISIPKLKTHQKVGATLNLKGLVGSITDKNQLVHWRVGSPETGGDEYPSVEALEFGRKQKVTHRGAWPGNDTIWRMVVDLYTGLLKKKREYLSIVDGIIGGEGRGPFCPKARYSNVLIAGRDLLDVDIVSARLMGINPMKIRYLQHFVNQWHRNYEDIEVIWDNKKVNDFFAQKNRYLDYQVEPQWECIKVDR